jgi:hypothetical protein
MLGAMSRAQSRIVVRYLGRDVAEIEPSTAVSENVGTHGGRFEGVAR